MKNYFKFPLFIFSLFNFTFNKSKNDLYSSISFLNSLIKFFFNQSNNFFAFLHNISTYIELIYFLLFFKNVNSNF